jgi:hypothetical protein
MWINDRNGMTRVLFQSFILRWHFDTKHSMLHTCHLTFTSWAVPVVVIMHLAERKVHTQMALSLGKVALFDTNHSMPYLCHLTFTT